MPITHSIVGEKRLRSLRRAFELSAVLEMWIAPSIRGNLFSLWSGRHSGARANRSSRHRRRRRCRPRLRLRPR